jgi:maltooligosyltrehalose trehalohydrolase
MDFTSSWRGRLEAEGNGYFSGLISEARTSDFYRYEVASGAFPDPASRFQAEGPHGPSQIIDSTVFKWTDAQWQGAGRSGQAIYEMHIGTFTQEGTWSAAQAELEALRDLGVTMLEVMPIADFPGRFGWGYDGVNLFAPTRLYGQPDDLRSFINRAHELGLAVILDVVYNHLGPDGNYLRQFATAYFTDRYTNEWGDALNFDDSGSEPVRELFVENAVYWIREFHFDGLRFDATQQIFDSSEEHVLALMARRIRAAAGARQVYLTGENEPQHAKLVRDPARGGYGLDALWNDDFHHSSIVALSGRNEAYYSDHHGRPQEFISAFKYGYLYQGQRYKWQKNRRGTLAFDLQPNNFICYIQNHDQVANSLWGNRLHRKAAPGQLRAMTALLLLGPNTPMLFQGQEFAASSPFLYFGEHNAELACFIAEGRAKFLSQFPSIASPGAADLLTSPEQESTFIRCKLKLEERETHHESYNLHRDLLRVRKEDPVIGKVDAGSYDGAVLDQCAFLVRFFSPNHGDRLLLINLGADLHLDSSPEPLLAPANEHAWTLQWSSEHPRYGGSGTPPVESEEGHWNLPGHSAVLMVCQPHTPHPSHELVSQN